MSDSKSNDKFGAYEPKNLAPKGVEIRSFKPQALTGEVIHDYQDVKKKFGSLAATDPAANPHFNLHASSKKGLGIEAEERNHLEGIVAAEVETRLQELRDAAYQEGFQQGQNDGQQKALEAFQSETRPLFEQFTQVLDSFDQIKREMFAANEAFLVQLIFQVGRQVLLKELSTDADYVKRLAAQVIEKVGAKENIRIKISKKDHENIEQLREMLKVQHPDLKNLQIEVAEDLALGGCKVETDLSRLNASVETQLQAIESSLGEA